MVFSLLEGEEGEPSVWFATCLQQGGIYLKMETILTFLQFLDDSEVKIKKKRSDWNAESAIIGKLGKVRPG